MSSDIKVCKSAGVSYGNAGDYGNAYRHTLWQSIITRDFDSEIAQLAGYSHEDGARFDLTKRFFGNIDNADAIADLLNNIIGRRIGSEKMVETPFFLPKEKAGSTYNTPQFSDNMRMLKQINYIRM